MTETERDMAMRSQFERFALSLDLNLRRTLTGLYRDATTQTGWVCWQEALSNPVEEQLVADVVRLRGEVARLQQLLDEENRSPTFAEVAAALDGLPSEHWVVLFRNGVCELHSDTTLSVVGYDHLLDRIRNLTPLATPWWELATLEELHRTALGKGTMVHDCILNDSTQAIAELRRRAEKGGG